MESLYTKYRPQTFDEVVGQQHVVSTLKRAVVEGRTSHAYLFCGPRGTGKTTMARILAKALMCEQGPNALPDGTCDQCRLIAAGEHPDVVELDAASRTGVDNVREEIISRVNYAPTRGRCKVYIIDEVHMLTTQAFNALLKTLEEPPEHVVFVMCTTDPQKIIPTILSRVQRFDFHAIANDEMQAHLADVCRQEGFTYEDAALELVVRHARGGMRDALTSLEQLSVFGSGNISAAAAQDFLGEVSGSILGAVTDAIARRDVPALFDQVAELSDAGRDLLQFVRELSAHIRDVYVVSVAPRSSAVVSATPDELERLRAEAASFGSSDRIARVLTILGDCSNQMRTATNQRLTLEIALTKISRPQDDLTLESLAERLSDLESQLSALTSGQQRGNLAPAGTVAPSAPVAVGVSPDASRAASESRSDERRAVGGNPDGHGSPVAPQSEPARPDASRAASEERSDERRAVGGNPGGAGAARGSSEAATGSVRDAAALQRTWKQVVDQLVARVPAKGSLLLSSTAVSDDGEKLIVSLPKGSHFAARMLERPDVRDTIDPIIWETFGKRQVLYTESSLAGKAISNAARKAAPGTSVPAPQPSPATQPAQVVQPAPAPQPKPEPQPAPAPKPVSASQPTPKPSSAPASQPMSAPAPRLASTPKPQPAPAPKPGSAPAYAMPWDPVVPPVAAPQPVDDDRPPYDDLDIAVYEENYEDLEFSASPTTSATPDVSVAAGTAFGSGRTTGEPQNVGHQTFGTASASGGSRPAAQDASVQPSAREQRQAPAQAPTAAPSDLSPEFADVLAGLTEAFGAPLSVAVEPAVSASDDDVAAELSYDDVTGFDAGYIDEPEEDGDDA